MPIVVKQLNYTYMAAGELANHALKDISLSIAEGEFLGIIGHTGSGKSTLVQHLNGLMAPEAGVVTVDEFDLGDKKQRVLGRRLVGVVFQYPEYQLFEETVAKDVAYGPQNMGFSEEAVKERVEEAMRLVGLPPEQFAEKSPFELSGGEKRRAALAGILAMRPKYLVLDEPMAGLDPLGRRDILDMLEKLRQSTGCAIVMVSHSMDDMARYATRIAVLSEGRIIADGAPREIFGNPSLLTDIGLDVPQVCTLCMRLRERGIAIPMDICDLDGMTEYLLERSGAHV